MAFGPHVPASDPRGVGGELQPQSGRTLLPVSDPRERDAARGGSERERE